MRSTAVVVVVGGYGGVEECQWSEGAQLHLGVSRAPRGLFVPYCGSDPVEGESVVLLLLSFLHTECSFVVLVGVLRRRMELVGGAGHAWSLCCGRL